MHTEFRNRREQIDPTVLGALSNLVKLPHTLYKSTENHWLGPEKTHACAWAFHHSTTAVRVAQSFLTGT